MVICHVRLIYWQSLPELGNQTTEWNLQQYPKLTFRGADWFRKTCLIILTEHTTAGQFPQ